MQLHARKSVSSVRSVSHRKRHRQGSSRIAANRDQQQTDTARKAPATAPTPNRIPPPKPPAGQTRPFAQVALEQAVDTVTDVWRHATRQLAPLPSEVAALDKLVTGGDGQVVKGKPTLLLLGSGWGAHSLLKVIDTDVYDVCLVSPRNHFLFTPMLPSTAVGTVEFRSLLEPIRTSNPFASFFEASCDAIDLEHKVVTCTSAFAYDGGARPRFQVHAPTLPALGSGVGARDVLALGDCASVCTGPLPATAQDLQARELALAAYPDLPAPPGRTALLPQLPTTSNPPTPPSAPDSTVSSSGGSTSGNGKAGEGGSLNGTHTLRGTNGNGGPPHPPSTRPAAGPDWAAGGQVATPSPQPSHLPATIPAPAAPPLQLSTTSTTSTEGALGGKGGARLAEGLGQPAVSRDAVSGPAADSSGGATAQVAVLQPAPASPAGHLSHSAVEAGQQLAQGRGGEGRREGGSKEVEVEVEGAGVMQGWQGQQEGGQLAFYPRPFEFLSLGIMAYVGDNKALTQIEAGGDASLSLKLYGGLAFLLWRSVYITKQVSFRNRVLILFDWIKTRVFGGSDETAPSTRRQLRSDTKPASTSQLSSPPGAPSQPAKARVTKKPSPQSTSSTPRKPTSPVKPAKDTPAAKAAGAPPQAAPGLPQQGPAESKVPHQEQSHAPTHGEGQPATKVQGQGPTQESLSAKGKPGGASTSPLSTSPAKVIPMATPAQDPAPSPLAVVQSTTQTQAAPSTHSTAYFLPAMQNWQGYAQVQAGGLQPQYSAVYSSAPRPTGPMPGQHLPKAPQMGPAPGGSASDSDGAGWAPGGRGRATNLAPSPSGAVTGKKRRRRSPVDPAIRMERREKNREAAQRCRARKSLVLNGMQQALDDCLAEHSRLKQQVAALQAMCAHEGQASLALINFVKAHKQYLHGPLPPDSAQLLHQLLQPPHHPEAACLSFEVVSSPHASVPQPALSTRQASRQLGQPCPSRASQLLSEPSQGGAASDSVTRTTMQMASSMRRLPSSTLQHLPTTSSSLAQQQQQQQQVPGRLQPLPLSSQAPRDWAAASSHQSAPFPLPPTEHGPGGLTLPLPPPALQRPGGAATLVGSSEPHTSTPTDPAAGLAGQSSRPGLTWGGPAELPQHLPAALPPSSLIWHHHGAISHAARTPWEETAGGEGQGDDSQGQGQQGQGQQPLVQHPHLHTPHSCSFLGEEKELLGHDPAARTSTPATTYSQQYHGAAARGMPPPPPPNTPFLQAMGIPFCSSTHPPHLPQPPASLQLPATTAPHGGDEDDGDEQQQLQQLLGAGLASALPAATCPHRPLGGGPAAEVPCAPDPLTPSAVQQAGEARPSIPQLGSPTANLRLLAEQAAHKLGLPTSPPWSGPLRSQSLQLAAACREAGEKLAGGEGGQEEPGRGP
ncbi:hypothetical protein QJQ45_019391 [Haematococcus lacustris]|nr:hypothetical protein QJQ45_019391 [Haematococcus lacustris]